MAQASTYVAGYPAQQKTKRYIAWLLITPGVATLGRAASLVVGDVKQTIQQLRFR